jgi:lipoate-protein ligase B
MTSARICCFPKPLPYPEAISLQEGLVRQRIRDEIPDTLLLLQHPPVITLGRRGRKEHLRVSEAQLQQAGIEIHTASRGGDVTAHAPGQWVLYPILKLSRNESGAHGYLRALESIALQTAEAFGIEAFRREGMAGAWCEQGKFCAIGFKFTRWVTWHGLALNVRPDLRIFDLIVGCGLAGEPVTSFQKVLGEAAPEMGSVAEVLIRESARVLNRDLYPVEPESLDGEDLTSHP